MSSRRNFLRGALSFAAAALAMPTALTDTALADESDLDRPDGCACEFGLPCTKGIWHNHYASIGSLVDRHRRIIEYIHMDETPFLVTMAGRASQKSTANTLWLRARKRAKV